ncbi:MAG: alpha/beta hydrolase family protein, partial [Planctomycetota bacterium]
MKHRIGILGGVVVWLGLGILPAEAGEEAQTLMEARRGFKTKLVRRVREPKPLEPPPPKLFSLVRYNTPIGRMAAYLSKPPSPGKKHPAIIWITGGFPPGGIGSSAWEPVSPHNDQSAKAYRLAGVVMMYPTVRGSFGNPGHQETFLGEVDDVVAALEYLQD